MQLKQLIDSPCGLKYMIDNLDTHSGYTRRLLLDSEMPKNDVEIETKYQILKEFYNVVNQKNNLNQINTLQFKLCNLKEIQGTINHLKNKYILDDIELFEVKHLAILSSDIQVIIDKLHLDGCVFIPNLEEVISILDPDGMKIATFYIYDSYNERLKELRRLMKEKDEFDETLFAEANSIEDEVRAKLSMRLSKFADDLEAAQKALSFIDLNLAKAFQMIKMNLVFPTISHDGETEYKGLFNPEIKNILDENTSSSNRRDVSLHVSNPKEKESNFQPISIRFGTRPTIIMGTNMGGKTVVLKTLALCQYLFQYGFGIPAAEAKILIQNDLFLCTTDEQSVRKGLSSFAAEMKNIDEIVRTSRVRSGFLALVDEPARTTNPTEGTALVSALVKVLQEKQMSLIIVTHYNINTYNNRCLRVRGFENGRMNYELVEVSDGEVPHEALNIAESLGVDGEWIETARGILNIPNSVQLENPLEFEGVYGPK